jgi:Tfp pilus assembly protein PilN
MIKINLMGKKKAAGGAPFGLDERFAALGISGSDLQEMRPHLIRLGIMVVGLYLANFVPAYIQEQKILELQSQIDRMEGEANTLRTELAAKRDIRKQMEQLNKEEVELQRQLNAVNSLQKDRGLAFRTIDNLMISMPQKVWIKQFTYKDKVVNLKGSCWEYFPINDFVKVINESTQYADVSFRGITTTSPSDPVPGVPESLQSVKDFEVEFRVKASGET